MSDTTVEAVAVEPEFVTVSPLGGGAAIIAISLARLTINWEPKTGSLKLALMASDVRGLLVELSSIPK